MQIKIITASYQTPKFKGSKFHLSKETIKAAEKSTGLTYKEMTTLPFSETTKLMKERGNLKEPSKFKLWLSDIYKNFGEKCGLLEKQYNFYHED